MMTEEAARNPTSAEAVVFVPEMEAGLPGGDDGEVAESVVVSAQTLTAFRQAWNTVGKATVTRAVTIAKLAEISRWAQQQTAAFSLPLNWADAIPMQPLLIDRNEGSKTVFVFGHPTKDGLPLPVHHATVFRRLVIRALFQSGAITAIYVSIRGWREE